MSTTPQRHERLRADLTLLLVSIVWGSAFAAQRVAALHIDAFLFNGLRFLLGAVVLLPLAGAARKPFSPQTISGAILAGLLLFTGAAFQQLGLANTTAGNAGFITGLYVVLIPLFLALIWRQWPHPSIWLASLLAAFGLFLLSTGGRLALAPGDGLELAGAVMWAFHVIWIGRLVKQVEVLHLAVGQYFVCGLLNMAIAWLGGGMQTWNGLAATWWAVLYTGLFSIGLGYTLQAVGQRVAPAADAAIILSAEAVFAAFFGWLFLAEQLGTLQLWGCTLIMASMLLAQIHIVGRGQAVPRHVDN